MIWNQQISFHQKRHRTDTKLSKECWKLKNSTHNHKYNIAFKKRYLTTKITGNCYLFLKQKLFIVQHQGSDLPNKRNEVISKCRHKSKFKFVNYKSWCQSIVTIFWYHSIVSLELFNKWLLRHEIISSWCKGSVTKYWALFSEEEYYIYYDIELLTLSTFKLSHSE